MPTAGWRPLGRRHGLAALERAESGGEIEMRGYVIPAPAQAVVPVVGGGAFPVRRIYCVGRNYAEHAREMGHDPDREPPFFFMKPADSLVIGRGGHAVSDDDVRPAPRDGVGGGLGSGGRTSPRRSAGACVGLCGRAGHDAAGLQGEAKKLGRPWDMGRGSITRRRSGRWFRRAGSTRARGGSS